MSKAKDVNLDDIWALVEEKETSGKLTRNDGIGDEWRGSEDDGQDEGLLYQEVDLKDPVPKPLRSPSSLFGDNCSQTFGWSFAFHKLSLTLFGDVPNTLQVLL